MQKHVGRVIKLGWFPAVAVVAVLVSDMPTAVKNADRNIHDLLSNAGLHPAPDKLATNVWTHPLAVLIVLALVFAIGAGLSWLIEKVLSAIIEAKADIALSPIIISEHLFCESAQVVDKEGTDWPDLEAVTLYLQIMNGRSDGVTLRGLRATLSTGFDKHILRFRDDASELRHGEVEMVELGTVVSLPPSGTRFASGGHNNSFIIDKADGTYIRAGGEHRKLQVQGERPVGIGTGVAVLITISADDTLAITARYASDFRRPNAYEWIWQEDRSGVR